MDHALELIIPILEILEIEVSIILQNPGNIGKSSFPIFLSWKYQKTYVFYFLLSWTYMANCFLIFPHILEILKTFFHGGRAVGGRGRRSQRGGPGAEPPRRAGGSLKLRNTFKT